MQGALQPATFLVFRGTLINSFVLQGGKESKLEI
jgi:hypothetical protein